MISRDILYATSWMTYAIKHSNKIIIKTISSGSAHKKFKTDVSKSCEVEQLMKDVVNSMGRSPDILINCAGILSSSSIIDMPEEMFDKLMATNLKVLYSIQFNLN